MRGVLLEFTAVDARLPDNRQQSTFSDFFMIRDGDGNSGLRCLFLHYHMTAALPYFFETVVSSIRLTSRPDKVLSLPNGYLYLRDVALLVQSRFDFNRRGGFEKQFQGFL